MITKGITLIFVVIIAFYFGTTYENLQKGHLYVEGTHGRNIVGYALDNYLKDMKVGSSLFCTRNEEATKCIDLNQQQTQLVNEELRQSEPTPSETSPQIPL